jgi:hypothetical protein
LLEGVGLGKRDGAPAVLVAVEQPLHPLLGAELPVEVLHLRNRQFNRVPRKRKQEARKIVQGAKPRRRVLTQVGRQLLTKLARDFLQSAG